MHTTKLRFVETGDVSLPERKDNLRTYMKKRRADNENRDVKENLLCQNVCSVLDEFEKKAGAGTRRNVFVYLAHSSEAPTDKLIEVLQEKGFSLFCPKVENGEMQAVAFGEDFTISHMGIREPVGEALKGAPDYVITPLLAADEKGNRLGYGKGYYDRYLAKYSTAVRIGYAFDFQILHEVPTNERDEKLDVLVTDKRVVFTLARE
jgi:5-formyltetrahydrofolate cyclo-ligase